MRDMEEKIAVLSGKAKLVLFGLFSLAMMMLEMYMDISSLAGF